MVGIVGCSNGSKEVSQNVKENNPEVVLKDFLDKRKDGKYEELAELVNPEYLAAMDLTKETYAKNIEADDFKYSVKIIDQKIGAIEKYDDNLSYVKVMTKSTSSQGENVIEEYFTINKEGNVGPGGFVRAYRWESQPVGNEKITAELHTYMELVNDAIIRIKWDNKTNNDIALGWVNSGKILVETDQGTYEAKIGQMPKIPVGYKNIDTLFVPNAKGALKKVTIGPLLDIINALPDMNNPTNISFSIGD